MRATTATRRRSLLVFLLCMLAVGLPVAHGEGVHLCRGDLDGPDLYRKIPAVGSTERTVMWRGRESRFPLTVCLLCDKPLPDGGQGGIEATLEGSVIRVCGPECQHRLKELGEGRRQDLAGELAQAVIQRDMPGYPLTTCPVTGRKLAGATDLLDMVWDNTLVRLASREAVESFLKDPDGYVLTVRLARTLAEQRNTRGRR
jgi:hypothetical protein